MRKTISVMAMIVAMFVGVFMVHAAINPDNNYWTGRNIFREVLDITGTFKIGGTAVTATATELNQLDEGNAASGINSDRLIGVTGMFDGMNLVGLPSYSAICYDEFLSAGYTPNAAANLTATNALIIQRGGNFSEVADQAAWMVTVIDGDTDEVESITIADNGPSGFLKVTCNNKAVDAMNIQMNGEAFKCDATRDLWYETRLEVTDVTEDQVVWGLATSDGDILGGYPNDYALFRLSESTNVSFITAKNGTSVTNANIAVLADATGTGAGMKRFGFFVDGSTTTLTAYVDGVLVATQTAGGSIPNDEALSPVYEILTTDTGADSIWVDYLYVNQTR